LKQDSGVKDILKSIVNEHLDEAASSVFVNRTLAIIDGSANTKESLMAAAAQIGRRIATLIDKDLAQTVRDSLVAAIKTIALPQGTRRRYRRAIFRAKVLVQYDGTSREFDSENISEGGIFLKTDDPFPAGSEIEITLSLVGKRIHLSGLVLDKKNFLGKNATLQPGMAVEFKEITDEMTEILRNYVQKTPD
jgi:hypothetical protein